MSKDLYLPEEYANAIAEATGFSVYEVQATRRQDALDRYSDVVEKQARAAEQNIIDDYKTMFGSMYVGFDATEEGIKALRDKGASTQRLEDLGYRYIGEGEKETSNEGWRYIGSGLTKEQKEFLSEQEGYDFTFDEDGQLHVRFRGVPVDEYANVRNYENIRTR